MAELATQKKKGRTEVGTPKHGQFLVVLLARSGRFQNRRVPLV
jgi:hypothetical protein